MRLHARFHVQGIELTCRVRSKYGTDSDGVKPDADPHHAGPGRLSVCSAVLRRVAARDVLVAACVGASR